MSVSYASVECSTWRDLRFKATLLSLVADSPAFHIYESTLRIRGFEGTDVLKYWLMYIYPVNVFRKRGRRSSARLRARNERHYLDWDDRLYHSLYLLSNATQPHMSSILLDLCKS